MKKYFLTGLVTLAPLALTLWVVQFVVNLLTRPFMGVMTSLLQQLPSEYYKTIQRDHLLQTLCQILVLISLFLTVLFLGFVARKYFFKHLISTGDVILHKIPLVNKVYKTSKEIVQALFNSNTNSFKQVVMLPFPNQGCYCIGLIARTAPQTCSHSQGEEMVSVFIPTTPNPATGFLVMSRKSQLIYLSMKSEDAIKYVVSCAVIQPEQRPPR